MNDLVLYPRTPQIWEVLQEQYNQQQLELGRTQAAAYSAPLAEISTGTWIAGSVGLGAALFLLFGNGSKKANDLALQLFGIGATAFFTPILQIP